MRERIEPSFGRSRDGAPPPGVANEPDRAPPSAARPTNRWRKGATAAIAAAVFAATAVAAFEFRDSDAVRPLLRSVRSLFPARDVPPRPDDRDVRHAAIRFLNFAGFVRVHAEVKEAEAVDRGWKFLVYVRAGGEFLHCVKYECLDGTCRYAPMSAAPTIVSTEERTAVRIAKRHCAWDDH